MSDAPQSIAARLQALGLTIPQAVTPVANYVPFTQMGKLLFISGQVPFDDGQIAVSGKLGQDVSLEDGQKAARICALHILAQTQAAIGDLEQIERVLKLTGFVNSTPDFTDQPKVINGASDFFVDVLAERGRHSRSAVSAASLPLNAAVEVEAIIQVK